MGHVYVCACACVRENVCLTLFVSFGNLSRDGFATPNNSCHIYKTKALAPSVLLLFKGSTSDKQFYTLHLEREGADQSTCTGTKNFFFSF